MKAYRYQMPTEVVLVEGGLARLAEYAADLGDRPLLVTGRHSARATGSLDRVLEQCTNTEVFDEVEENPSFETCEAGAVRCRQAGCDYLLALGGGSPIDAAKAIAALACMEQPSCAARLQSPVAAGEALPLVAIPTTAGTGSEATPYSVLVDRQRNCKVTMRGPGLFPRTALLDPELSVTMPRHVTVATGLDALSQAMEGVLSHHATPMGDTLALETCRLVRQWLPRAANHPNDVEARAAMLHAAMLSGCVIAQSRTTLVHGMGYYFTLNYGVAHGLANALLLPPVFQHNAREAPGRVAALAGALGVSTGNAEADILEALYTLYADLELSPAAQDAGVENPPLADWAAGLESDSRRFKNQPGEFDRGSLEAIFRAACEGKPLME